MLLALDLDGTLIDARARQVAVARHAVKQVTARTLKDHTFWELKRAGASTEQALVRLGYTRALAREIASAWAREIEADRWLELDRALPDAREVLAGLRAEGVASAVITARRRADGAERSLALAGLRELVDELLVVEPAEAVEGKTAHLMRLGAVAFVGDTDADGQAAALAATPFVAVATGQRSPGLLRALGRTVAPTLREAVAMALENARAYAPA